MQATTAPTLHPAAPAVDHASADGSSFRIGNTWIDPDTLTAHRDGHSERLTKIEYRLMRYLHDHPNQVLSRDHLYPQVWGYRYFGTSRTLDQFIVKVRRKLGDDPLNPSLVVAVRGEGYLLSLPTASHGRRAHRNRWNIRVNTPKLSFSPGDDVDHPEATRLLQAS